VFIRSMATRGTLGGLANTTAEIVQVLDAAGYEIILIETVGAGQSEVDIARLADTTLVIEAPNMGDDIQAIKAGILEIADLLVINKADLPGVEITERALRSNLELAQSAETGWQTPILKTTAATGEGVEALAAAIREHRAFLGKSGEWQRRERVRLQSGLDNLIQTELSARWRQRTPEALYQQILEDLSKRRLTPHQALKRLLGED
jgi:LAO/AO transport system kinase